MFDSNKLSPEEIEDIVKKYNQREETLTSLARRLGCSAPTVGRLLKKHGAEMRGKGRPKGSKTVNHKPVSVAAPVSTSLPEDTEKSDTPTLSSEFASFQQKVMQYKSQ